MLVIAGALFCLDGHSNGSSARVIRTGHPHAARFVAQSARIQASGACGSGAQQALRDNVNTADYLLSTAADDAAALVDANGPHTYRSLPSASAARLGGTGAYAGYLDRARGRPGTGKLVHSVVGGVRR